MPRLDAARVRLRALTDSDLPALFEVFGDAEAMRYWSAPTLADIAGAHALLADIRSHFEAKSLFQWGVARLDDDRVIGTCTLLHIDEEHRRAEIGFALSRAFWGKGYASEAVTALIRFAYDTLDLHRLEADADPRNAASIAVLVKQGFRREGFLRERYFLNDAPQDAEYYGLLRREWTGGQLSHSTPRANPPTDSSGPPLAPG